LGLHELRKNIVVIPQDPVLLAGTLEFNVDPWGEYGKDKVISSLLKTGFFSTMTQDEEGSSKSQGNLSAKTQSSVVKESVSLKKDSENLGKYDKQLQFLIKDGGSNLSVGQRQLVCIARAMI
jgi:ABC-type multidrug transport system fused ATPase/permease subunit